MWPFEGGPSLGKQPHGKKPLGQIPHLELAERRAAGPDVVEAVQEEEEEAVEAPAYQGIPRTHLSNEHTPTDFEADSARTEVAEEGQSGQNVEW